MNLTIKSRKLNRTFEFWAPPNGGYIRLESDDRPGTLGQQICAGGDFMGNAISCQTEDDFKKECRAWYRAYIRSDTL